MQHSLEDRVGASPTFLLDFDDNVAYSDDLKPNLTDAFDETTFGRDILVL
jgi:hypothetical protein